MWTTKTRTRAYTVTRTLSSKPGPRRDVRKAAIDTFFEPRSLIRRYTRINVALLQPLHLLLMMFAGWVSQRMATATEEMRERMRQGSFAFRTNATGSTCWSDTPVITP